MILMAVQDKDLRELRDTREWLDMMTEVKGGLSREQKINLRTEAKVGGVGGVGRGGKTGWGGGGFGGGWMLRSGRSTWAQRPRWGGGGQVVGSWESTSSRASTCRQRQWGRGEGGCMRG